MKKLFFVALILCAVSFAQTNVARMLSGVNAQTGTSYTFVASDVTKIVTFNNSNPVGATLLAGSTSGFGSGSVFTVVDLGAGTVTIVCSGCTINGAASVQISQNSSVSLYGDGANYISASGSGANADNFASPPPLGNVAPNTVGATTVTVNGDGLFFQPQSNCIFEGSDPTLHEVEDVSGKLMWLYQGLGGPCTQILTYTPLPDGVNPTDKQVPAWDAASGAFTIQSQAGGSPGGSNTQVQFNDSGSFNGDSGLTYNKATKVLGLPSLAYGVNASPAATAGSVSIFGPASSPGTAYGLQWPSSLPASGNCLATNTPTSNVYPVASVPCGQPAFEIRNYGCVADDTTDNATCFANWAAAVNAYAGAGIPEARCDMGPGDKAYLTSAGVIFTIPVYVAGNCTIDAKSTFSGVLIQLGASGASGFTSAGIPPYTVDGLTFIGGAGGATGIQVQAYISNSRIIRNTFLNFGTAASTSWPITTVGANNEVHISDNYVWSYDATVGRNGIACVDTIGQPSDSCEVFANTMVVAQPPAFTGPCGGTGLYLDGSHVHVFSNDIFGYNNDIRIANSSTGTNKDYVIEFNALDSDGCANGTVKSAIQLGSAGNVTNVINDVLLHGNQLSPRTGLTLFDVAGDNTYGGVNLFSNVRATENFCVTCSTQAITSVSGYRQGRDNWSFTGTDAGTNNTPSFLQPLILGTISTPTAPASGKHAFFLPSSGNDAGLLCAVNNGGGVYCYAAGPALVTASIGGSSVPANSCADTAVTVTGANNAFNQMAVVGPVGALAANWANFTWTGYVSAANTAQVHICNVTAGALTPTAMTFAIKVIQ